MTMMMEVVAVLVVVGQAVLVDFAKEVGFYVKKTLEEVGFYFEKTLEEVVFYLEKT